MDTKKIAEGLHSLERKVLPQIKKGTSLSELIEKSKLSDVEVMRALQWLSNKKLIEMQSDLIEIAELDENGKKYLEIGLPEKRFAKAIENKELSIEKIKEIGKLDDSESNVSVGFLKQKGMIFLKQGMIISLTDIGKNFLKKESLEEVFIKKLKSGKIDAKSLAPEEKFALDNLKKRKGIVKTGVEKNIVATLTELGEKVVR
jgi:phenylalanyl-tRNA synthetase alpha chain